MATSTPTLKGFLNSSSSSDIFGGRGPWVIPSTNQAQWGSQRAVDSQGNLYRLDPETGEPIPTGQKATPEQIAEAAADYSRRSQLDRAQQDRVDKQLADYRQAAQQRYSDYQQSVRNGTFQPTTTDKTFSSFVDPSTDGVVQQSLIRPNNNGVVRSTIDNIVSRLMPVAGSMRLLNEDAAADEENQESPVADQAGVDEIGRAHV